ncbi:MAG: MYXO-CTERM sorting domain-containing protein [Pseudomonadota bacterium]
MLGSVACSNPGEQVAAQSAQPLTWGKPERLLLPDGKTSAEFGIAVALSGNTAVIGASAAAFTRDNGVWSSGVRLRANMVTNSLGAAMAVSGDTAIVAEANGNSGTGAVFAMVRTGSEWNQQGPRWLLSDGVVNDDFGYSVAISGDTALVGARRRQVGSNVMQGAAYVYVRSGTAWTQQATITASDGAAYDFFGEAVALQNDTAVVLSNHLSGAEGAYGAAYVYTRNADVWSQQGPALTVPATGNHLTLPGAIALDQDTILWGAGGVVCAFVRVNDTWLQQGEALRVSDAPSVDNGFGASVALFGDTALIGEPLRNQDLGAAFVFVRSSGVWTQQGASLTSLEPQTGSMFGDAVAISTEFALVGAYHDNVGSTANQGSVYSFTLLGGACSQGTDCASGACADGVCCDSACSANGEVCSKSRGASEDGVCFRPATPGFGGAPGTGGFGGAMNAGSGGTHSGGGSSGAPPESGGVAGLIGGGGGSSGEGSSGTSAIDGGGSAASDGTAGAGGAGGETESDGAAGDGGAAGNGAAVGVTAGNGAAGKMGGGSAEAGATGTDSSPVPHAAEVSDCSCRVAGGSRSAPTPRGWLALGLLGALLLRCKPQRTHTRH